jgi:hypothetical protein
MPPLILEASFAFAILARVVKITGSVNRIEQSQKVAHAEVLGKIEVVHTELASLKEDNKEIKAEVRENRKFRFSDKSSD